MKQFGGKQGIVQSWFECLLILLGACALVYGWNLFWFLTDDAFITFRYASSYMQGWGLTWNPPPFKPVEGYTNFLWLMTLIGVWQLLGVEPPDSANYLSLFFGLGQYAIVAYWLSTRLAHSGLVQRISISIILLMLLLSNRTFLTWLSSGLETALFNFLILVWVLLIERIQSTRQFRYSLLLLLAATAIALCRPDGLLFWAASGFIILMLSFTRERILTSSQWACLLFVAALIPAHICWRYYYYGELLPNTYWVKVGVAWPEAGMRYLASFLVEYGLYIPLLAAVFLLGVKLISGSAIRFGKNNQVILLASICLLFHLGYYVFKVGGDHFEYRVLSYWVPLTVMLVASIAGRNPARPAAIYLLLSLWLVASLPIQWGHWWHSKDLVTREQTLGMIVPVADKLPGFFSPLTEPWDRWQRYLIKRNVGVRHQEHKVFYWFQAAGWPSREQGSTISWSDRHSIAIGSVGVPAWVMPEVAVIDVLGLNDYRVAHAQVDIPKGMRTMAHDRIASVAYMRCFQVSVKRQKISLQTRLPLQAAAMDSLILTKRQLQPDGYDALIEDCEARDFNPVAVPTQQLFLNRSKKLRQ